MTHDVLKMLQFGALAIGFGLMAATSTTRGVGFWVDVVLVGINWLACMAQAGMLLAALVPSGLSK